MQGKIMDKPTNRNSGSQGKKKKSDRVKKDQPKIDYQGLVENSISALAVLDRNGTVLYSNQRGIEVWNDPHIVGKTIFDLFPPDYVQRYQVALQHVIDSDGHSGEHHGVSIEHVSIEGQQWRCEQIGLERLDASRRHFGAQYRE